MSRAVDADVKKAVHNSDPELIYTTIADVLCRESQSLLEIEFLGKSHTLPPGTVLLEDENSVAIPKSNLVLGFLFARRLLFEELRPCPQHRHEDLLGVTAVILLMDPEHLTAANARKRYLHELSSGNEGQEALKRELRFVDSYLTSRLHRHTKSPTLWSHRRWLLTLLKTRNMDWDVWSTVNIVLTAAERHPRNYYAWLHLRWIVQEATIRITDERKMLETVQEWSMKHPSDTSGFSFLYYYVDRLTLTRGDTMVRSAVFDKTMSRTETYGWTNESVWVFLRTLAASDNDTKEVSDHFEKVHKKLAEGNQGDLKTSRTLHSALEWYQQNKAVEKS